MRYTKLRIKNFKGIKNLELDLNKNPKSKIFTLVGLNESGKTSILEAINLIQNKISDEETHKMIHKSQQFNFNDKIIIEAELELEENDEKEIKKYCKDEFKFNLTESVKIIHISKIYTFTNSKKTNYESLWEINLKGKKTGKNDVEMYQKYKENWEKVVEYIQGNLFPKILYYENFLFDFPQKIYLKEYEGETKEQKEYRKVLQDILDSFNSGLTIDEHLLERLEKQSSADKQALNSLLGLISEKLTDKIFKSWNEIFIEGNNEIELSADKSGKGFYIDIQIKQGRDKYLISERSLGFRWFFSFLLFTEFRKERNEEFGETLFLLDEPASNLHSRAQKKLLNLFGKLTDKCKLIYSTHSHHLINPKFLEATYIIRNKAINYENEENFVQTETDIEAVLYKKFVADYPKQYDYFQPILDSIHYCPSSLEQIPEIVCFEGKFDYYTFSFIKEKLSEKDFNFNFYPGAGVDKYENHFRLYLSWNKNFIAIFDSDKQGESAKKRYIREISDELKEKVFTLEDINLNWTNIKTEDLFSDEEKIKIIQGLYPEENTYNKSKFNIAIQDLFINKKDIRLSIKTLNNFKKIFDFIKEKLEDFSKEKIDKQIGGRKQ